MKAYQVSKEYDNTLEEKLEIISNCDVDELLYILREFEQNPNNYDKQIVTELYNKLFEYGITCL